MLVRGSLGNRLVFAEDKQRAVHSDRPLEWVDDVRTSRATGEAVEKGRQLTQTSIERGIDRGRECADRCITNLMTPFGARASILANVMTKWSRFVRLYRAEGQNTVLRYVERRIVWILYQVLIEMNMPRPLGFIISRCGVDFAFYRGPLIPKIYAFFYSMCRYVREWLPFLMLRAPVAGFNHYVAVTMGVSTDVEEHCGRVADAVASKLDTLRVEESTDQRRRPEFIVASVYYVVYLICLSKAQSSRGSHLTPAAMREHLRRVVWCENISSITDYYVPQFVPRRCLCACVPFTNTPISPADFFRRPRG